ATGTAASTSMNAHSVGPLATIGRVGLVSGGTNRVVMGPCGTSATPCIQPHPADSAYIAFVNHYGSFNVTMKSTAYPAGGRGNPLVLPTSNPAHAYVVCTTCH